MKKALVLSLIATALITFSAFATFNFGYLHGVPDNDGKFYIGLDFGDVQTGAFETDIYVGKLWQSAPVLGIDVFYVIDPCGDCPADGPVDMKVGGFLESSGLDQWPTVGTGNAGLYFDGVFHILPGPCSPGDPCGIFCFDLICNLNLGIDTCTGLWDFGGEFGIDVTF